MTYDHLNPTIQYGEMVDERDGQIYKTIVIGRQTWFAQNLNFERDSSSEEALILSSKYGMNYSWNDAIDIAGRFSHKEKSNDTLSPVRGICPEGWHIPSLLEARELLEYIYYAYEESQASSWMAIDEWEEQDAYGAPTGKATDKTTDIFGFSALPMRGSRAYNSATFWTRDSKMAIHMNNATHNISTGSTGDSDSPYQVRCIKDTVYQPLPPCKGDDFDTCKYGSVIDEKTGYEYKTVFIGEREWLAENIDTIYTQDYDCYRPKDKSDSLRRMDYGCIRTIYQATTSADFCPSGWKPPSEAVWSQLFDETGARENPGVLFKVGEWDDPKKKSSDSYGFGMVPTGYIEPYSENRTYRTAAAFWITDAAYSGKSYPYLIFRTGSIRINHMQAGGKAAIRCVKRNIWN